MIFAPQLSVTLISSLTICTDSASFEYKQQHLCTETHTFQPKKKSCIILLQLRLSCCPHNNENSSSLVTNHCCCFVLIFHSNLRHQKLELHSPYYTGAAWYGLEMLLLYIKVIVLRAPDSCWSTFLLQFLPDRRVNARAGCPVQPLL